MRNRAAILGGDMEGKACRVGSTERRICTRVHAEYGGKRCVDVDALTEWIACDADPDWCGSKDRFQFADAGRQSSIAFLGSQLGLPGQVDIGAGANILANLAGSVTQWRRAGLEMPILRCAAMPDASIRGIRQPRGNRLMPAGEDVFSIVRMEGIGPAEVAHLFP